MPKATLTFNLPEEQYSHYCAINGEHLHEVLREFDDWLRKLLKYGPGPSDLPFTPENVRDHLREEMGTFNVSFQP